MGISISVSENQVGETSWPYPWVMLASGAAYYVGAMVGFALTFQPVPISILWPPNAILLGALLSVPSRNWWLVLIAALPAHLFITLENGVPIGMVLCWFISNSCQALFGAFSVRRILGQRIRFYCFQDVAVFIVFCAFLAPFLSSFLDVAFVKLFGWGSGPYWELWRLRFFSNVVAVLIIVPPLLTWRQNLLSKLRSATFSRRCETVLLATGLLSALLAVFMPTYAAPTSVQLLLYVPLPLMLWLTVRFDPFWTSMSVLVLAFLAIWATVRNHGPFSGALPAVNALSIQFFLISISAPLLLLSAALEERRRSLVSMRHDGERLDLVTTAGMGSWHWDLSGKKASWSPELRLMLSVENDDSTLLLATLIRRMHRDDRASFLQLLRHATSAGAPFEPEFRVLRPTGQVRWILNKVTLLCDESGRRTHMLGVAVDVTERRLAEAITRDKMAPYKNEKQFRQIADMIPQIIWAARPDGYIDYANCKWKELTAAQDQPAGDATWLPLIHPEDRQRYLNSWYSAIKTDMAFAIEYRILFPNARAYRWHLVSGHPVKDETGCIIRWYGTATDIDDEKRAEHALASMRDELERTIADRTAEARRANDILKAEIHERKKAKEAEQMSEARFAKVFRLSPDAMYISTDADGRILDVNERWLSLFKYERKEVIGKTERQLDMYVGDKDAMAAIELNRMGGSIRGFEVELRDKENGVRRGVVSGEAVATGDEACFITIIRDVTEERRAQAEMQQQRELLTRLTRVVMLGELSGALAHELNQPLAAILTNAQAARRFMASNPVDLQEIGDILNDIVDEDKRAGEVIRRLRVLFMKGEPSLHPLNFNEVVQEAIDLARSDLVARKVKLRLELSQDLGTVQGDKIQLQQVILNLIVNAFEAMSDRAEGLRLISFTTGSDGDGNVRITVSDSGTGIPPALIEKVFDPVFTTKVHGLGFGLSISRSIIKAHGGSIEAHNLPQGGASFWITLPLYRGDAS
jgi:PAS domain S-box-containing protein